MDELTLLQRFRAERAVAVPEARAAIWHALEGRIAAAAEGAGAPAPRTAPARRGFLARRRLLAFAAAIGAAAAVALVLVLNAGPTAQPAAAEILHDTATVAAATDAPAAVPGPGQFYYRKIDRVELTGWLPPGAGGEAEPGAMQGGVLPRPDAFKALVPRTSEEWLDAEGAGRLRQVTGTPSFFAAAERAEWEAAGSPLPGEPVLEDEHGPWQGFHFPDTSKLPTEPRALREAVEANAIEVTGFNLVDPKATHLDEKGTAEELINILFEGNPMRPALRAAIFNALAELPGIELNTDATDFRGRHGDSIRFADPTAGAGTEFIFDPQTAELVASREFLVGPPRGRYEQGIPAGTTVRESDYLEAGVVDSTHSTAVIAR